MANLTEVVHRAFEVAGDCERKLKQMEAAKAANSSSAGALFSATGTLRYIRDSLLGVQSLVATCGQLDRKLVVPAAENKGPH